MEAGVALTKIFENGIASGAISIEDMFDTNMSRYPSSWFSTALRIRLGGSRAAAVQEAFLAKDPRMAFCVMMIATAICRSTTRSIPIRKARRRA